MNAKEPEGPNEKKCYESDCKNDHQWLIDRNVDPNVWHHVLHTYKIPKATVVTFWLIVGAWVFVPVQTWAGFLGMLFIMAAWVVGEWFDVFFKAREATREEWEKDADTDHSA